MEKGLNITYREITPGDDAALAEIIRHNLKAHGLDIPGTVYYDSNLDHLSDFYLADPEKRFYYMVLENGAVIGGIGLAELSFIDDCAELQKIYLTDAAKGRGIGYDMMQHIEEKARALGYKKMYLETHTNLAAAIHIYDKCGYTCIDRPAEVVHSTMNLFFMKDLETL